MTLKDLANKFTDSLKAMYEEDEAQAIFLIALAHATKFNRAAYLLKKEELIAGENLRKLEAILSMLIAGKPIQYITGETLFYGLPFKVNPSVLIPRPETEELVEWMISVCSSSFQTQNSKLLTILDIGTGSGCIAISLKKNLPNAKVYALDITADTLETAQQNAILNEVEVEFISDDILKPQSVILNTQYDVIVSNPPYIKEDEKPAMHDNVLANEPHRALFVSNEDPLIFYNAIADFALKNLTKSGLLFLEINEYLGQQTANLLKDKGFTNIELRKDMQGKDRMICCQKAS
jgi:release factor glutamine methyltransferase